MKLTDAQRQAYAAERKAARVKHGAAAFAHLERAHIIGQRNVRAHTAAHLAMLGWGWRQRHWREAVGQVVRAIAALTKTLIWVPEGNTGGANVNPFKPMPIPQDLQALMADAERARRLTGKNNAKD